MLKRMVLVIVLFFIFSGFIQTQQFVTVPGAAFKGVTQDEDYDTSVWGRLDKPSSPGYLQASVYLPQNAVIDSITLGFWDNTDTGYINCRLYRLNLYTAQATQLFSITTIGLPSESSVRSLVDSSLNTGSRVVKNNSFGYFIELYFSAPSIYLSVYSVKIKYH